MLGAIAVIADGHAAYAQGVTGNLPDRVDSERDPTEIIVTAQRREQRLQDVPISVAVVSGNSITERGVSNFEQLAPLVPNLTIVKTPAANLITLRGIGSSAGSPSLDQSVVMFIDNIYAGNARQFAAPFMDIERLEVLRGPQGALVGRNTSAGAINIITRKPGREFAGYLDSSYNFTFNGVTLESAIDIPVADFLSIRVAGRFADTDGYMYNSNVDEDQPIRRDVVGRITAVVDNGGPVIATFKYEHADVKITGTPIQVWAPGSTEKVDYVKTTGLTDGPEYDDLVTNNFVGTFDVYLGNVTLTSITGFSSFENRSKIDADFYYGNFATADFDQQGSQFSQELRLTSDTGGTIEYSGGLYYSTSKLYEQRTTGVLFAPAASTYRQFRQQSNVFSAYGQATVHLTDAFRVNGSLRFTTETKDGLYRRFGGPLAATDRVGALLDSFEGSISGDRVDPALSVQFDATSNLMIYASFGKGSKSAGFQGAISNATADAFDFRPEVSTAYEGGVKITIPQVGYFNLAGFYTVYRDLQVSTAIATQGALAASFFTGNAPKAEVAGLEAEFSLRLAPIFTVSGSASWLPTARYVDFTAGPCYTLQPPDGSLPGSCDQTGARRGFAPKYSGSITATLDVPVSDDLKVLASVSPIFQGQSWRAFVEDPLLNQNPWFKMDARLGFGAADDRWQIAIVGQNLTNKTTIALADTAGLANTFLHPAARQYILDPSRSISIQGRIKF